MFQHVSTIQGDAAVLPSTVCLVKKLDDPVVKSRTRTVILRRMDYSSDSQNNGPKIDEILGRCIQYGLNDLPKHPQLQPSADSCSLVDNA